MLPECKNRFDALPLGFFCNVWVGLLAASDQLCHAVRHPAGERVGAGFKPQLRYKLPSQPDDVLEAYGGPHHW